MKTCSRCHLELPVSSFHLKGRGYRRPECKDCFKAALPRSDREALRAQGLSYKTDKAAYQRFYKYGITEAEYRALLAKQADKCAICGTSDPSAPDWQVDHDHASGKVRGLLCRPCNIAIGLLSDDVVRLRNAIAYLQGAVSVSA